MEGRITVTNKDLFLGTQASTDPYIHKTSCEQLFDTEINQVKQKIKINILVNIVLVCLVISMIVIMLTDIKNEVEVFRSTSNENAEMSFLAVVQLSTLFISMVLLIADTAVCLMDACLTKVQIINHCRAYKAWSLLIFTFAFLGTIVCWCNVKVEFLEHQYTN